MTPEEINLSAMLETSLYVSQDIQEVVEKMREKEGTIIIALIVLAVIKSIVNDRNGKELFLSLCSNIWDAAKDVG